MECCQRGHFQKLPASVVRCAVSAQGGRKYSKIGYCVYK